MKDSNYLYLMCNPNMWFGNGNEKNYQVNEILFNLGKTDWGVSSLKKIFIGMQGIIKVSRDDRPKNILDKYKIEKLESGIYATFEVIDFFPDKKDGRVSIQIVDNFFHQNKIINKEKSKEILGDKFNAQNQGYIDCDTYKLVYEAINEIPYNDIPKLKKELITEKSKEIYPRDEEEKALALKLANYKCEVDEKHTTFITKSTNKNYVEGHHLIPISQYAEFKYDVDVKANIVSLCPTCHRKLHSGVTKDIDEILEKLYLLRSDRLKKVGLGITIDELKYIYCGNI